MTTMGWTVNELVPHGYGTQIVRPKGYNQGFQDRNLDLEIVRSRASPSLRRVGAVLRSEKTAERKIAKAALCSATEKDV